MRPGRRNAPFAPCQSGVAFIEFGLLLPLFILLFFGVVEVGRYALIHQKLDKTVHAMGDMLTQEENAVSVQALDSFIRAAPEIMRPFRFNGQLIFTSAASYERPFPPCRHAANSPCVYWQYAASGSNVSRVGSPGTIPALPGNYAVQAGQNVIAVEAFYDYAPLLPISSFIVPAFGPRQLYKVAVYKPRQGTLTLFGSPEGAGPL